MKIVDEKMGIQLELIENQIQILVLENEQTFSNVIMQFLKLSQNVESQWLLMEQDKILQFHKIGQVIVDPFSIDNNERKIIQKVYQEMQICAQEEFAIETAEINACIVSYIEEITQKMPYNLVFDLNLDFQGILKTYGVRLETCMERLIERLVDYIKLLKRVLGITVVVFINLKTYLSEKELELLYEACKYEKIYIILIENVMRQRITGENICIVDRDGCIIKID